MQFGRIFANVLTDTHLCIQRRLLYIYDPLALNTMLLKDQNIYQEGATFADANLILMGPGVGSVLGEQHRRQRKMLNPLFSVKHMRNLLPIFYGTIDKLRSALMKEVNGGEREIDFLQWMERTILEVIGQAGFGYSFDPLTGDAQSEFGAAIKSTFSTLQDVFIFRPLIPYVMAMGPAWFRRLLVELLPSKQLRSLRTTLISCITKQRKYTNLGRQPFWKESRMSQVKTEREKIS